MVNYTYTEVGSDRLKCCDEASAQTLGKEQSDLGMLHRGDDGWRGLEGQVEFPGREKGKEPQGFREGEKKGQGQVVDLNPSGWKGVEEAETVQLFFFFFFFKTEKEGGRSGAVALGMERDMFWILF